MGTQTIHQRPATSDDREAIREVARAAWHDAYDDLDAETIDQTVDDWYDDESFETALDKPGTAVIVAEVGGPAEDAGDGADTATDDRDLVGFVHGVVSEDEGDVLRIYVHPDHQGHGIGTGLHERLREDFADFNMARMRAIDLASNDASRRFYEELGYDRREEGSVEIGGEERQEAVYTLEL